MLGDQSWIRVNPELNLTNNVRSFKTLYSIIKHTNAIKSFLVMTIRFIQPITARENSWAKSFAIESVSHLQ